MQIVYIDNMYENEEQTMREHGVSTARIDMSKLSPDVNVESEVIFRGPKMNSEQYKLFLFKLGIDTPLVTPEQYDITANALEYSRRFGVFSPKTLSFSIDDSVDEIVAKLKNEKLPLFVRSDIESAVKYVGLEACILRRLDDIENVLQPIHRYIKTAQTLVMKEVVPLRMINSRTIEYRAIVIKDRLICFDFNSTSGLPDPMGLPWEHVIKTASKNGMHGAYFLDLGVDTLGRLVVVECKNLINGTIENVDLFAEGIKTLC